MKKKEKKEKLTLQDRRAEYLVSSTKSVQKHFEKKNLPPMGSQSPQREEKALDDYWTERETQRARKRRREDTDFDSFFKSASEGKPTAVTTVALDKMEIAELANQEGRQQYGQDLADGIRDALKADVTLNHLPALLTKSAGYQSGFQGTFQKRPRARLNGSADGFKGLLLAMPNDFDPVVSNQLKTDYALGYNDGP